MAACLALCLAATARAAPFRPSDDQQVLERLPGGNSDPRQAEMRQLRRAQYAQPQDVALAVRLANRYFEETAAEGDPRYIGYAQSVLAPWWGQAAAPPEVKVVRAKLRQFNHDFPAAVADLQGAVQAQPTLAEGWSWLAAIAMVQARYGDARQACARLQALTSALTASACTAGADAITGQADLAVASLRQALIQAPQASAAEKLWALTRLAETEERRGDFAAAEAAFKAALALGQPDGYLLAATSDFLLDRGRPAEVLALLKGRERADLLLLRLALAARDAKAPEAAALAQALGERFDAARLRGDTTHQKEEARFALALRGDTKRALELAQANWAVQKEPADARVLLEAAVAAKVPAAAESVLQWMAQNKVQSVALLALAQRLRDGGAR
ncbi:hypothetical protein BurJ1DRAFT_4041 [Burkholderiales bacterium JOSHI_001]|nr:hypothetical protein BurJ1DRAFT_4041 [Burkholderiales bacterium JOSHI_001]